MVVFSVRRKLLRQRWLQDPQEWQRVNIWLNGSHELSLGARIYSVRDQQQAQDRTTLLYVLWFCPQVTPVFMVKSFTLIRETNINPRIGYLNSNSDVDVESPCGPTELFLVCSVSVPPCAVCRMCIYMIGFVPK